VVLLHGLTDSSACWPLVRDRYPDRLVVALDAPGHGGRPLGDVPFTIAALAADAVAALRARDLGPAVLVGHSMGGVTAEEVALTAPDLVAALVLEDPAWREVAEPAADGAGSGAVAGAAEGGAERAAGAVRAAGPAAAAGAVRAAADAPAAGGAAPAGGDALPAADDARLLGLALDGVPDGSAPATAEVDGRPAWLALAIAETAGRTVAEVAALGRRDNPAWSEAEIRGWAEARLGVDPRIAQVPHEWTARDWVGALADVATPVTLLTAEPGHGVVTPAQAARAVALLGDRLTHVPVAGAGHSIRRDAPQAYLAALDAALAHADAAH
jgi:pimeloyl-ACP methyl ester carboxylesterase